MRLVSVICLLAVLGLVAGAAMADPNYSVPKNWYYHQDNIRATYPEDEGVNNSCPGQAMACNDVISPAALTPGDNDWYYWNANQGDQMTMWTGEVNPGDSCDTYIELYRDDCATMLAYNDDFGSLYSRIENFVAPYTGRYDLKVRGYSSSSAGPYAFHLECGTPPPPPDGDVCSTAFVLDPCGAGSLNGTTAGFNNDYDPGSGGCASGYAEAGRDEVYKADFAAGTQLHMSYTQLSADGAFYVVTDCANVAGTCVAGADATVTGQAETINYTIQNTGTYYIILDSYGSNTGGAWTMDYTFNCPVPQACCFDDGSCDDLMQADCYAQGGTPQGGGTNCDNVTCPVVPTRPSTWGQIKSTYR